MKTGKFTLTNIAIGIVFTLMFISLAVIFTINFRPLYYLNIRTLNIEELSGMNREEIILNYDALIDYSSPFFYGEFKLPTLPSSPQGIQHFEEVKDIFIFFYILAILSTLAAIIIIRYKSRKRDYKYLLVSSITVIVLPLVVGLLMFLDFDTTFRVFHELFFDNDYWIFDATTDPVIRMLPSEFFLNSALLIILIMIGSSLLLYFIYRKKTKNTSIKYRKNEGLKL